jgi:hypothetical protein
MTTTLIQDLLQTVDDARGIATDLGVRLYRVFMRVRTWSGTTQGEGTFTDVDTELLPRPRLRAQLPSGEIMPIDQVYTSAGMHFEGTLDVDKISALTPLAVLSPNLTESQRQYVVLQGADGGEVEPLLYVVDGAPIRRTLGWVMRLKKVHG